MRLVDDKPPAKAGGSLVISDIMQMIFCIGMLAYGFRSCLSKHFDCSYSAQKIFLDAVSAVGIQKTVAVTTRF